MKPLFYLLYLVAFIGCTNKAETGKRKKPVGDGLYSDYQIWGEEGAANVTVRLQFHAGNDEGNVVALQDPGKVLFDGEEITADSARLSGAYYEVSRPVAGFGGTHTIVYVDKNRKEHRESFQFQPFSLAQELPDRVRKKAFQIQLDQFPTEPTTIRLVMVDTSLQSIDVNEELVIENGTIEITDALLQNLTKGPVTLEIYREDERPVGTAGNGRLAMSFGLKREFTLID